MHDPKPTVELSRPSFNELSSRLGAEGHQDALLDTGEIQFGNFRIVSTDRPSAVRLAARMADQLAAPDAERGEIYEDDRFRVSTKCRHDGVHIIVRDKHNTTSSTVVVPRCALVALSADLIDCIARPPHDEAVDDGVQS